MARNTGPGHDKSDRALDKRAFDEEPRSKQHWSADEVRKHDDDGRDRLFEGREQHDEADKNQDKIRSSSATSTATVTTSTTCRTATRASQPASRRADRASGPKSRTALEQECSRAALLLVASMPVPLQVPGTHYWEWQFSQGLTARRRPGTATAPRTSTHRRSCRLPRKLFCFRSSHLGVVEALARHDAIATRAVRHRDLLQPALIDRGERLGSQRARDLQRAARMREQQVRAALADDHAAASPVRPRGR